MSARELVKVSVPMEEDDKLLLCAAAGLTNMYMAEFLRVVGLRVATLVKERKELQSPDGLRRFLAEL